MLHRGERRTQTTHTIRETEAEAVAFVVCSAIGLDTNSSSADHVTLHGGDKKTLAESLALIQQTAARILEAIEPVEAGGIRSEGATESIVQAAARPAVECSVSPAQP